jgi:outer membrane receptor protein involved in Fe transport
MSNQSDRARQVARCLLLTSAALVWSSHGSAQTNAASQTTQTAAEDGTTGERPDTGDIVVTGTRLAVSGFTSTTPVTALGAERMAAMAAPNVGEALASLPSFRSTTSPNNTAVGQNISPVNAGARIADLRGLGTSRTLVLVNNRRFVPSTNTGTVDLNMIPTLLVQRAEVVTGGASAAYGSDAVSGVINIILDTKLEGIRTNVGYGVTDKGDGEEYSVQFAAGTSIAGGRGHAVFGAEYNKSRGTGGCYTRNFCNNEVGDLTGTPGVNGRPAHNITYNLRTATLTPGGLISATVDAAGVRTAARGGPLSGIQFDASGQPTGFTYGTNANSLFQEGGSGAGLNTFFDDPLLQIPVTRYNGYGYLDYEFSPAFTGFVEASYGHVAGYPRGPEIRDIGFPAAGDVIKVDNPYLPTATRNIMVANNMSAIVLGKIGNEFGKMDSVSERDVMRVTAGGSGELGGSWKWDAHVQWGVTDYHQSTINNRITANFNKAIDAVRNVNGDIVCRVNADASTTNDDPACRPLNIIGTTNFTQEAKAYAFGASKHYSEFSQLAGAANIQGELFDIGAGPAAVAMGVEARRNKLDIQVDPISARNGFYVYNATPSTGTVTVKEGYLEAAIPLMRDGVLGSSLELNGAVRYADYSTKGQTSRNNFNAWTWKAGATYRPVDWVLLRTTYSRDIRAPNASELFTTPVGGQAALYDTKTSNTVFVQTFTGGNINLTPETARTFTAGFTLQPRGALAGFRFSVDYYDILVKDAISTIAGQRIVDNCNATNDPQYCSLVTRDVNNQLSTVSILFLNLNQLKLRGVDFEGSYRFDIGGGTVDLRALATHNIRLESSATPGVNRAGDNGLSGVPSWVVDAFAGINFGRFGMNLQGHFLSAGKVDASFVGPEDAGYSPTLSNSINTNRVPSRFYTNAGLTFDLINDGKRKVQIYGNVLNLFNVTPPPYWNGDNNSVNYDNVGRRYRVGVRTNF